MSTSTMSSSPMSFGEMLDEQRWDDHRFYHHSTVNQSLHLFSSLCFVAVYFLLATDHLVAAAILGWPISMIARQIGHFFFEPKEYDNLNKASFEEKEAVKVGYNLFRKRVLLSIWALSPLALYFAPSIFTSLAPYTSFAMFLEDLAVLWIGLAVGALAFRTVHLFFLFDVKTGLVWITKIITDPFHDIYIYHKAPLYVLRGQWIKASGPNRH